MRVRVSCICDLIAAEGKYHLKCYLSFFRKISRLSNKCNDVEFEDIAFEQTMQELSEGLQDNNVYELSAVWKRYCENLKSFDITPGEYRSNRFKEKIQARFPTEAEIIRSLNPSHSTLIFPSTSKEYVMNEACYASEEEYNLETLSTYKSDHDTDKNYTVGYTVLQSK